MAFLCIFGIVFQYDESKKYFKIIRDNFVKYVIKEITKQYSCRNPFFGYEFEFHKIKKDDNHKKVLLDLSSQYDIMKENEEKTTHEFHTSLEFGGWMLEIIPKEPFGLNHINLIEKSVTSLYEYLNMKNGPDKYLSLSSFPLLGVGNYYLEEENIINNSPDMQMDEEQKRAQDIFDEEIEQNKISESDYISDKIITKHPRFGNLARNIRLRRGKKVDIRIPLFRDKNTDFTTSTQNEPYPGEINMDAMGFGMGCCCLQVTIGSTTLNDALNLYDQLLPLTPLFLALSSNSPIFKGKLSRYDNRWLIISKSVDDRTDEERDPNSANYIYKSRYSASYSYIGDTNKYYNNYPKFPINEDYYKQFIDAGINENLATHFCNLLARDPLVIFSKKLEINDPNDMAHFENLNSTNWNSLRFKLPRPSDTDSSYKIEVRTCELQIAPFANSSMIILIMYLYKIIEKYGCDFIIPMTKVDENFLNSYEMDAINKKKFWWRVNCFDKNAKEERRKENFDFRKDEEKNIKLLSIDEIFNGAEEYNYPGLLKLIRNEIEKNDNEKDLIKFVEYFEKKTCGKIWTDAKYIRDFVNKHPKYKHDSIVTEEINYDLINHCLQIQNGYIKPIELLN